jgi:hypothetical protein
MSSENKTRTAGMALLLLALATMLILFSMPDEDEDIAAHDSSKDRPSAYSPKVQELVNKHLQMTQKKIELGEQQAGINYRAPEVGSRLYPVNNENSVSGIELPPESGAGIGQNQQTANSPDAIIQREIHAQEANAQASQAEREEYARQFKENARRNGWEVTLNEDFVVTGVRPIKKGQSFKLFAPTGQGSR